MPRAAARVVRGRHLPAHAAEQAVGMARPMNSVMYTREHQKTSSPRKMSRPAGEASMTLGDLGA